MVAGVTIPDEKDEVALSDEKDGVTLSYEIDEVTLSDEKAEVTLADEKDEVTLADEIDGDTLSYEIDEVTLSGEKGEVTLSGEKGEVTLLDKKDEVTLSDEKDEVTLSDEKDEVTLPDDKEDVTYLDEKEESLENRLRGGRDNPCESRCIEPNKYLLYTRKNPKKPQFLVLKNAKSVSKSNYDRSKPLAVLAHGWLNSGYSENMVLIRTAFIKNTYHNVIVADYKDAMSCPDYSVVVQNVVPVGRSLGEFLEWLVKITKSNWKKIHLVGFSLGAHVVGNAGRTLGGVVARITALDPASPQIKGTPDALKSTDSAYVEVIHTDAFAAIEIGIKEPIGTADFYPNGDQCPQPGCPNDWLIGSPCSHSRAYRLFASSLYTNHFRARHCRNLDQALGNNCHGEIVRMGNAELNKRIRGIFGLTTKSKWPY